MFAIYYSMLGPVRTDYEEGGITGLTFVESIPRGGFDISVTSRTTDMAFLQLEEYLMGERRDFLIPIRLHGTDFQMKVWKALLAIPYGETRSYSEIAAAVGKPKACRAVASACARNPIPVIVPCHRVIAADGSSGGYSLGIELKKKLLNLEKDVVAGCFATGRA